MVSDVLAMTPPTMVHGAVDQGESEPTTTICVEGFPLVHFNRESGSEDRANPRFP
jgi:hypothetical protein